MGVERAEEKVSIRKDKCSVASFLGQMTKKEDHHSFSVPDTLFGEEVLPSSIAFCFESKLKPEKNKDKERSQILKQSSWGVGTRRPLSSNSGLAACAGLVDGSLLQRQNNSGSKPSTRRACASAGLGHQCQLTARTAAAHRGCVLAFSKCINSHPAPAGPDEVSCPRQGRVRHCGPTGSSGLTPPKGSCPCRWPHNCKPHSGASLHTPWRCWGREFVSARCRGPHHYRG